MPSIQEVVLPTNSFVDVETFNMIGMEVFRNYHPNIRYANTKFMNFQDTAGQRGITTTWELPPHTRFIQGSLSIPDNGWDSVDQRPHSHTVDEQGYTCAAIDAQQRIFNDGDKYMDRVGKVSIVGIANGIEANVVQRYLETYRFFEFDDSALLTYTNLRASIIQFKNYGYAMNSDIYMFIPDIYEPQFVNDGLGQFAIDRNNRIANSWEIAELTGAKVMSASILPEHIAGVGANADDTLTLTSVSANGTTLTFSGATVDTPGYFVKGDLFEFNNGTGAGPIKYLFFNNGGNAALISSNNVQCVVDADAESIGGSVTVTVNNTFGSSVSNGSYPLISDITNKRVNLSRPLVAGPPGPGIDTVRLIGNHRAGLICNSQAIFLSMPRLPNEEPYFSSNIADPESGLSIRLTYGSAFGKNFKGFVWSVLWGTSIVAENAMRLIFSSFPGALPLSYLQDQLKDPSQRRPVKSIAEMTREVQEKAKESSNYKGDSSVAKPATKAS